LVEIAALGRRVQQGLVYGDGYAEVVIDSPTAKLQLQQIQGAIIGDY
jgi:hypothetical protein